eukprot:jgi/Mesvir1/4272/Mv22232-RA.1
MNSVAFIPMSAMAAVAGQRVCTTDKPRKTAVGFHNSYAKETTCMAYGERSGPDRGWDRDSDRGSRDGGRGYDVRRRGREDPPRQWEVQRKERGFDDSQEEFFSRSGRERGNERGARRNFDDRGRFDSTPDTVRYSRSRDRDDVRRGPGGGWDEERRETRERAPRGDVDARRSERGSWEGRPKAQPAAVEEKPAEDEVVSRGVAVRGVAMQQLMRIEERGAYEGHASARNVDGDDSEIIVQVGVAMAQAFRLRPLAGVSPSRTQAVGMADRADEDDDEDDEDDNLAFFAVPSASSAPVTPTASPPPTAAAPPPSDWRLGACAAVVASLTPSERRRVKELVAGVTRHRRHLDFLMRSFWGGTARDLERMEPHLRQLLRVGLLELTALNTPAYAAVSEAVDAARLLVRPGAAALVNAVLRATLRAIESPQGLPTPQAEMGVVLGASPVESEDMAALGPSPVPGVPLTPEQRAAKEARRERERNIARALGILHSHPTWVVKRWVDRYGEADTTRLLVWDNAPPAYALRANARPAMAAVVGGEGTGHASGRRAALLLAAGDQLRDRLEKLAPGCVLPPVPASGGDRSPPGGANTNTNTTSSIGCSHDNGASILSLFAPVAAGTLQRVIEDGLLTGGACSVQDVSAGLVVSVLDPQPGESVIDCCAAPGGKATLAAMLVSVGLPPGVPPGRVLALDVKAGRVRMVQDAARRLGLDGVIKAANCDVRDVLVVGEGAPVSAPTSSGASADGKDGHSSKDTQGGAPVPRGDSQARGDSEGGQGRAGAGAPPPSGDSNPPRKIALRQLADRVLVDAPCSGLGVLAKRADMRWRRSQEDMAELVELQRGILAAASRLVRPGGVLVYSTCTIEPQENWEVVSHFLHTPAPEGGQGLFVLESVRGLVPDSMVTEEGCFQSLPHRDNMDGSFAARLRRVESA